MTDPFARLFAGPMAAQYSQHSISQERRARDTRAYFDNLAMPGLAIIDRDQPVLRLGPDGKPLTLEERQRLFAGRAAYNPDGTESGINYIEANAHIEHEPLGASAQRLLPGMRIITPVEARLPNED